MSNYKVESVDLGIIDKKKDIVIEGDLIKLKNIIARLKSISVNNIKLVGNDVSLYRDIEELLFFAKKLGINVSVSSKTHDYVDSSVERVANYVSNLETTINTSDDESYERLLLNLLSYDFVRKDNQKIGVNIDLLRSNYDKLYEILYTLKSRGIGVDYAVIRRELPFLGNEEMDAILTPKQMNQSFEDIIKINEDLRINTKVTGAVSVWTTLSKYYDYVEQSEKFICDFEGDMFINGNGTIVKLGNVLNANPLVAWSCTPRNFEFKQKLKRTV